MAVCELASVALALAGCDFDTAGTPGCVPVDVEIFISGVQACAIATEGHASRATTAFTPLAGPTCDTICGTTATTCTLPADVLSEYLAGQAGTVEADGASAEASVDAGDAGVALGSSDAGKAGDSTAPTGCPAIAPTALVVLDCTSTCSQ